MSAAKHTPGQDWYERRHELEPGMVFKSCFGIVQLDQRTEGDGTQWDVLTWNAYAGCFSAEGCTVEPGDLEGEPIEATKSAIAKATGSAA